MFFSIKQNNEKNVDFLSRFFIIENKNNSKIKINIFLKQNKFLSFLIHNVYVHDFNVYFKKLNKNFRKLN
jgi:hypothetical protein